MIFEITVRHRGVEIIKKETFQIFDPGNDQDREIVYRDHRQRPHRCILGVHYGPEFVHVRLEDQLTVTTRRWIQRLDALTGSRRRMRNVKNGSASRFWVVMARAYDDGMPEQST